MAEQAIIKLTFSFKFKVGVTTQLQYPSQPCTLEWGSHTDKISPRNEKILRFQELKDFQELIDQRSVSYNNADILCIFTFCISKLDLNSHPVSETIVPVCPPAC